MKCDADNKKNLKHVFHSRHRVVVLDKVTDFILFLGKLLIVGLVGTFSALDCLNNTELNIRFNC